MLSYRDRKLCEALARGVTAAVAQHGGFPEVDSHRERFYTLYPLRRFSDAAKKLDLTVRAPLLAQADDTYEGMSRTGLIRAMRTEDFELIADFEAEDRRTGRSSASVSIFGRKRDGHVVSALLDRGGLKDLFAQRRSLELKNTLQAGLLSDRAAHFVVLDVASTSEGEFSFLHRTMRGADGLRLRLHVGDGRGRATGLWANAPRPKSAVKALAPIDPAYAVIHPYELPEMPRYYVGRSVRCDTCARLREERLAALPEEWRDILDIASRRTSLDVLREALDGG